MIYVIIVLICIIIFMYLFMVHLLDKHEPLTKSKYNYFSCLYEGSYFLSHDIKSGEDFYTLLLQNENVEEVNVHKRYYNNSMVFDFEVKSKIDLEIILSEIRFNIPLRRKKKERLKKLKKLLLSQ